MKILTPTPITTAALVACNVPENDHPEWSAATAYTVGDRVMVTAAHRIYQALTANTAKPPATNPEDWIDLGATHRWRMFDNKVGTTTGALGSLTFTLAPGVISALALINLSARSVAVKMTDPVAGVVYDRLFDLYDPSNVTDWYTYLFDDIRISTDLIVRDLPVYLRAQVEVTISHLPGEEASVGAVIAGRLYDYGSTSSALSAGIRDYSRKERDEWGNLEVVERAFSKRARWNFVLPNHQIDVFQSRMASLRAKPAVYIGDERYASTIVYGYFTDFDVVISYPQHSECAIEIEGLV